MKIKSNKTFFQLAVIFAWLIILISCKKLIEVTPPKNQLVTAVVFKDSADATAAVVGIYATIMELSVSVNFASGAVTIYTGLLADELNPSSPDTTRQQFYTNLVSSQNTEVAYWWVMAYKLIYHANACIEGLTASKTLKIELRNQLLGEAKFIRGWLYFNLVNLFGGVPLVTSINYRINAALSRASADQVYEQIISDLTEARQFLPSAYPSSGKGRPNRFTVTSLLARVYLFQKKWDSAESEASKVINAGMYTIEPDLKNVFRAGSSESIWQMPPVQSTLGTPEGRQFIPADSAIPNFLVTIHLLNAFESNDRRYSNWIRSKRMGNINYFFPFKYKLRTSPTKDEHYVMQRLAEQFLIRAEARAMRDDLPGALNDLNIIRTRAGLDPRRSADKEEIVAAIMHERRLELFCESGHRWYDLNRMQKSSEVLGLVKPGWQNTAVLLPIPYSELITNPFLIQNPGY